MKISNLWIGDINLLKMTNINLEDYVSEMFSEKVLFPKFIKTSLFYRKGVYAYDMLHFGRRYTVIENGNWKYQNDLELSNKKVVMDYKLVKDEIIDVTNLSICKVLKYINKKNKE